MIVARKVVINHLISLNFAASSRSDVVSLSSHIGIDEEDNSFFLKIRKQLRHEIETGMTIVASAKDEENFHEIIRKLRSQLTTFFHIDSSNNDGER